MTERETKKREQTERKLAKKGKKTKEKTRNAVERLAQGTKISMGKMLKKAVKSKNQDDSLGSYEEEAWAGKTTAEKWNSGTDLRVMQESLRTEQDEVLAAMWPLRRCPGRG
jgi:hypothetical protein